MVHKVNNWTFLEHVNKKLWLCKCDCGATKIVNKDNILIGKSKSCGCHRKLLRSQNRIQNKYIICENIVIFQTINDNINFIIDTEELDKIKNYTWEISDSGYIYCRYTNNYKTNRIYLHKIIANTNQECDHINRVKLDNRKCNLRTCNNKENSRNQSLKTSNKSGVIGVRSIRNKWESRIMVDGRVVYLGLYNNLIEAIIIRLQAEIKYFGEFAPQKHLFEKYLKKR